MTRDYEQTALELVGRWTIACPPEHPLWNHRRMAIAAALRTEHLATLREAREALPQPVRVWPGEGDAVHGYNDGIEACRRVLDRLIAEAEKESETDG